MKKCQSFVTATKCHGHKTLSSHAAGFGFFKDAHSHCGAGVGRWGDVGASDQAVIGRMI